MKRVRCPKCDNFITFDETKYEAGQSLVFVCPNCNKQFGIRMGVSKLRETRKEEQIDENTNENGVGSIVVIENVFAYKQVIPLQMGDNVIGRYMKNSGINCPIETVDPSVDMNHCVINVSRDKKGKLKYVLRDGPSYTGTFVDRAVDATVLHISSDDVVAHLQRDDLLVGEYVFDNNDGAYAILIGIFINLFFLAGFAELGYAHTDAKLLIAIRAYEDQALACLVFGFVERDEIIAFRATYSFHIFFSSFLNFFLYIIMYTTPLPL
jgi:uncharacterized protein YbaR (Trm112 family)